MFSDLLSHNVFHICRPDCTSHQRRDMSMRAGPLGIVLHRVIVHRDRLEGRGVGVRRGAAGARKTSPMRRSSNVLAGTIRSASGRLAARRPTCRARAGVVREAFSLVFGHPHGVEDGLYDIVVLLGSHALVHGRVVYGLCDGR